MKHVRASTPKRVRKNGDVQTRFRTEDRGPYGLLRGFEREIPRKEGVSRKRSRRSTVVRKGGIRRVTEGGVAVPRNLCPPLGRTGGEISKVSETLPWDEAAASLHSRVQEVPTVFLGRLYEMKTGWC